MQVKRSWLPDMDLNHDKQIQSLLCYRYTIGQTSASKVGCTLQESRLARRLSPASKPRRAGFKAAVPEGHPTIAQRFNVGEAVWDLVVPKGRLNPNSCALYSSVPSGLTVAPDVHPTLKRWAILNHPSGMTSGMTELPAMPVFNLSP